MAVFPGVLSVMDVAAPEQGIVLAVGHDELIQSFGSLHGLFHHFCRLHAPSVIGEGADPGGHGFQLRQLPALLAHGDGAVGQDPDDGVLLDGLQLYGQMLRTVRHGVQIGHGHDGGIAAPGAGPGPCGHGFLMQKTRLLQMYMYIRETG